ncbi:MAG: hypothetical protein JO117_07335, partial [Verrucomicrobia bacterium]|nr:hypothetical protein [Verrucomicrobiota bacterium]
MLYVDVTSSCKSPMNTGVQRAVRGLFRHLQRTLGASAVMPVLWEPALRDYCRLSARERGFLEKPFAGRAGRRAREEPGRAANPVPGFSKLWRQIVHRRNRLDLARWLGAADTLFVPEIFQDGRIAWLRQFDSAAAFGVGPRRVAVFHDAIVWKQPAITPGARQAGFTDYMQVLAAFDAVVAVSREAANDLQEFWATNCIAPRAQLHVLGWPAEPLAESASA